MSDPPSNERTDSGPRARPESSGSGDPPSIGTITRMFRLPPQVRQAGAGAPVPAPRLSLRLRTKLVVALVLASLVPVLLVALLATNVILSSLEASLGEDAARQLTVGLNLVLRSVERLGDECVQLAEAGELATALDAPGRGPEWIGDLVRFADPLQPPAEIAALDAWIARQTAHVPSARLQVLDARGDIMMNRTLGGADARFVHVGVAHDDPLVAAGKQWGRGVSLVTVGDVVVMRAVSPILDEGLTLRGMVVMSTPLDGDFADAVKGALSADVLLGGPSGTLAVTMHSPDFTRRAPPLVLSVEQRVRAMSGERVLHDYDVAGVGSYKVAVTALIGSEGRPVGLIGVALDRGPLERTKALAVRTLIGGGLAALTFAVVLALFWSRRIGAPIARLHEGASAVSRGDLDHRIELAGSDELADLATAFNQMTSTLKDNQARLAARMREIVALHDAGRAVSSVIDIDPVARKIVDAVARTFDVQLVALWLVDAGDAGGLAPFAARARRPDVSTALATDEALSAARALQGIAERVRARRAPLRLALAGDDPDHGAAAAAAGAPGPLVALPLERKGRIVGVLVVGRGADAREFSDADLALLTTFADQAGAAVENARLYSQVRDASEELEKKVQMRTRELTAANQELGKALADLRETQAQLVLSERMAGLGVLVAGVAHEINSPTAAIRGSIAGLGAGLSRVTRHSAELAIRAPSPAVAAAINAFLELTAPQLAERPLPTSLTSRRAAREVAAVLERAGLADASQLAADLADLGATAADADRLAQVIETERRLAGDVVAALTDRVYVHRTDSTVRDAVQRIQRIVGALKSYSHLDQQALRSEADLHEGIETTLVLLHHTLRDIVVERRYGSLPRVPVYVDELNQVWTNLIANAQQALKGKGTISLETAVEGEHVAVRVVDDGPGVPPEILSRIFEPFFTTKAKGEGTGLGLGISRRIVEKHGGEIRCTSQPGRTVFEVRLPVAPAAAGGAP
ncbi:MAG TPA: ATP-binding protein [Kofleriaceae bacterium]|nr:ATP-binding protein [Kofleriaceae bacterium]